MYLTHSQLFTHSCLKNCDSNCVFTSQVDNLHATTIHLEQKEKSNTLLCAHAFSAKNNQTRLSYPLYQEKKGSNQWKRITWEETYTLIVDHLKKIYRDSFHFSSVAWHKGTGNLSVANYCVEEFFYFLNNAVQLTGNNCSHPTHELEASDLLSEELLEEASLICIWGQNTVSNYKHLLPRLLRAKENQAKLLVIDPYFTKTAQFANYYLQIEPTTDILLLEDLLLLFKGKFSQLFTMNKEFSLRNEPDFPTQFSSKFKTNQIETILQLMLSSPTTIHLVGNGMKKHHTYPMFENRLKQLLHMLHLIDKKGWIMKRKNPLAIFSNQKLNNPKETILSWHDLISTDDNSSLKFLWNSGSNPMRQVGNSKMMKQLFYEIDFVVTTEQFMTDTAQMSNLVLPVTTNLEELNLIINRINYSLHLNEPSKKPFGESKSEFTIFNELATRLKEENFFPMNFPSYLSTQNYLLKQWNEEVSQLYGINSLEELKLTNGVKKASFAVLQTMKIKEDNQSFSTNTKENQASSEFPFYLLTPHHPNQLNSQLIKIPSISIEESVVLMNEDTAKKYGITNGELLTIYNHFTSIEIKAALTKNIHEFTLMIYNGMTSSDHLSINQLVSSDRTKHKNKSFQPLLFDTFVAIEKLPSF